GEGGGDLFPRVAEAGPGGVGLGEVDQAAAGAGLLEPGGERRHAPVELRAPGEHGAVIGPSATLPPPRGGSAHGGSTCGSSTRRGSAAWGGARGGSGRRCGRRARRWIARSWRGR